MPLILAGALLALFCLGVPVAFATGLTALLFLALNNEISLMVIPQRILYGIDAFELLAIPFFLLAGTLLSVGGVTVRLVNFAQLCVGWISGGLGNVVVLASMIMSGMSGSAVADVSATGSVLIPSMIRAGYPAGFAAAVTASAATVGPMIPPSINFVIYGALAEVSTGRLFAGGVVPGVIMGLYMMGVCWWSARKRGFASIPRPTAGQVWAGFVEALPGLGAPVIVMGGILGGVFTTTEASVIAVVYALVLGLAYRELSVRTLIRACEETLVNNGVIMLMIGVFSLLGWIFAFERLPALVAEQFTNISSDPLVVFIIVHLVFLVLGILIEPLPLLIVVVPIFLPLIKSVGIDPVHFGVVITLNLMIALLSPPVGMLMFIACQIGKVGIDVFSREVVPFLAALIVVMALITVIPDTVLWLPDLIFGP